MALIGAGLLLIAAVALRVNRLWSLPLAFGVSGKLLREGQKNFNSISEYGNQMF
jgi:hypothetical protein